MKLTDKHPWSRGDMDRYGRSIRDGTEFDKELGADIIVWHEELVNEVEVLVDEVARDASGRVLETTARVKTAATTRDKLLRQSMKLSQMQDFAGVRVTLSDGLAEQVKVVDALERALVDAGARTVKVKPILEVPHSGYRAVHLHVTAPAGRLEVQVRTATQDTWANAYEALGDLIGREVRYGDDPASAPVAGVVSWMQSMSDANHAWEMSVYDWELSQQETVVSVDPGLTVFGGVKAYRKFIRDHRNSLVESMISARRHFRNLKEAHR